MGMGRLWNRRSRHRLCIPRQLLPWAARDFHESHSILLQDGEKLERDEVGMVCLDPARFGLLFPGMVASPGEMSLFSRTAGTTIPPDIFGLLDPSDESEPIWLPYGP